ncbi:pyridoxal phosphate-dependent aminotransferase [Sphaerimonospora mesophila]|uniref:pyridoxal phosphate-dependent aminotransferase n=1 Tax=Sphaerimonospora mesophila TaxID=37483 RepID=UPI0006E408F7
MQQRPLLRPWLEGAVGYRPGLKAATQDGRLASNECPAPPAWLSARSVDTADLDLHRYPDPEATALRTALGELHGVDPDEVVVGNGSDELIMLLIQAYAAYTGSIVTATPGYSLYELCAGRLGARVERVPLIDWRHDLGAMATADVDVAFICNPHNPTGTVVRPEDLLSFIGESAARMIVIDEAYVDFAAEAGLDTVAEAVREPRVVVLRTFSKAHALAGVRVGYLVAHRDIAQTIARLRLPFSVNTLAQITAANAVAHHTETANAVGEIVHSRLRVEEMLRRHGLEFVPSQANFILVLTPQSDLVVDHLASHGIAVRPGRDLGVPDAIRLTIPSAAGLARLDSALAELYGTVVPR